jgi:hypothetical protein
MPANFYQIAYDHAGSEIAEIGVQLQSLNRRRELLEQLLEPLRLLVSKSGSSTTPAYAIAYDQATSEIAEIDAQIQNLPRRKVLLEQLLEPLKVLVFDSDSAVMDVADPDVSDTGFLVPESAAEESLDFLAGVPEAEPDPFEDSGTMLRLEVEEPDGHAERNGRSNSSESQNISSEGRTISAEDIAELAYRFWDERGRAHGHHEEDWLRATLELQTPAY